MDPTNRLTTGSMERRRELACPVCLGDWKRCKFSTCPKLEGIRDWAADFQRRQGTSLYGATPPSAFVGEWGYPMVLAGPLVPPTDKDVSLMDAEESWLDLSLQEILMLRMSMVRGKRKVKVDDARQPGSVLETMQEIAMASAPVYTEMLLTRRPGLQVYFSPRGSPLGPSAPFKALRVAENPKVARRVDYVVSDTDLMAEEGGWDLYSHGIGQRHIARILSLGLLGQSRRRRLVPTEWSITAIDDLLGKRLRSKVRYYPEIGEYQLFGHEAVANNVQILLIPGPWMFEALEGWVAHGSALAADHEMVWGRRGYPTNLVGAYHAVRLPILEHLHAIRRQAIALTFLEVYKEWIPLGVWRFRELAREAFRGKGRRFSTLEESLEVLRNRLAIPLLSWLDRSKLYSFVTTQKRLEDYLG
ncbi:MAG: hypothetical protein V3U52_01060 [Thermoplasmata archaeon]